MELNDKANLLLEGFDKIAFYWNFLTLTVVAILGWLISATSPLRNGAKILITIGYLFFAAFNLFGLENAFQLTEALRVDTVAAAKATGELPNATEVLERQRFDREGLAYVVHALLFLSLMYAIWLEGGRRAAAPPVGSTNALGSAGKG